MIDQNGEPILSIYETPRPCPVCGKNFTPPRMKPKALRFNITMTCSDTCARLLRRKEISGMVAEKQNSDRLKFQAPRTPREPRKRPPKPILPPPPPIRSTRVQSLTGESTFGQRLAYRRVQLDLSTRRLADLTGIHVNSIFLWEKGETADPKVSAVHKLSLALNVSMEYLWTGKEHGQS